MLQTMEIDNTLPVGISVIIPVYKSSSSLPILIKRLEAALLAFDKNFEVILVDDCSPDTSWTELTNLSKKHTWIRGISLTRNFGQHNALLCGIRTARYDTIVTMDDDLQNPPEEIATLLATLYRGYDVVYGVPGLKKHSLWRNIGSGVARLALGTMIDKKIAHKVSSFRAFHTHIRTAFSCYQGPTISIDALLAWGAKSYSSVPVSHDPRKVGRSGYTFRKLASHAISMVVNFSSVPLRIATLVGLFFSFFGIAILIYVVVKYLLYGAPVKGFPFLASIIAIFSGAQLFALGIMGEYLSNIHFRVMGKPSYAIRTTTAKFAQHEN